MAGLGPGNVEITGGVRVPKVSVEWVAPADALPPGEDPVPVEPGDEARVLVVRTRERGDFSTYTLRLVASEQNKDPPEGFDRILREVPFSFKVECATEFDCLDDLSCPPTTPDDPLADYLAKDYASFRQRMLDRIATLVPDWTERSPADLAITLVELLAYAGDRLSYYQDAVATEAYLGTARKRVSVRRHARLVDYPMHDGVSARAWVSIEVGTGEQPDGAALLPGTPGPDPDRTRFLTRIQDDARVPPDQLERVLSRHAPETFEAVHPVRCYPAHNLVHFHTWGDEDCCLPRGATSATLRDVEDNRLLLVPGDVLILEEVGPGGETDIHGGNPARRHAVRLTEVTPAANVDPNDGSREAGEFQFDDVTDAGYVEIAWDAADAFPFSMCISETVEHDHEPRVRAVARGNVVLVEHGRTAPTEEIVPPGTGARLDFRPRLGKRPVSMAVPYDHGLAVEHPASKALHQDPREALPVLRLTTGTETWEPRRDLLSSDPFARHVVVEAREDGSAQLRFGDGVKGRAPPRDEVIEAHYRTGLGPSGNVGAEAIRNIVTDNEAVQRVRNPLPATGGVRPERLERVRLDAPVAFRTQERAVTTKDYAEVAERHGQVQRAMAARRWTGSWHTMFLTVDRLGGRPVDDAFEGELVGHVSPYRLCGHDVEAARPEFVSVDIVLTVCVEPDHYASDVKRELLRVFSDADLPDGRRGFFHPDTWTFGQPLYLSRVIAAAMRVQGVAWVDVPNKFQRWGEDPRGEAEAGVIAVNPNEIIRAGNDPNRPEHGRIDFHMEGGL